MSRRRSCPFKALSITTPTAPNWPSLCISAEEAKAAQRYQQLLDDIIKTTVALEQMVDEKVELDEELFLLRAPRAPIGRVPDDILAEIFLLAADTWKPDWEWPLPRPSQYHFSRVCRRWRAVARGCTPLWTDFLVYRPAHLEIVEASLARYADTAPIAMELRLSNFYQQDSSPVPFLTKNSQRFTALSLQLDCWACQQPPVLAVHDRYTQLHSLYVKQEPHFECPNSRKPIDLTHVLNLQSLTMDGRGRRHTLPLPLFPLNTSLTDLHLSRMTIRPSVLRSTLHACPSLRRLSLLATRFNTAEENGQAAVKVEVPHLENLRMAIQFDDIDSTVEAFDLLNFSGLRSFDLWCCSPMQYYRGKTVTPLLRQFHAVHYVRIGLSENLLKEVTAALWDDQNLWPRLRTLHLDAFEGIFPENEFEYARCKPLATWFPDFAYTIMPITKSRWALMLEESPSACLILPPRAPLELLDWLRQHDVRVETISRHSEAWPGSW